jgi:hypothetical protein
VKLDSEQQHVLNAIRSGGKRNHATPMEQKAAVAIGLVESGLRNLPGGDRDSQGWRQERASLYKDPTNLQASVDRVYAEMRQRRGKYATAGDLAAAVQRPAAQYRGRYAAVGDQAAKLLGEAGAPLSSSLPTNSTTTTTGPSVAEQRQGVLTNYLSQRGRPGSLAALAGGLGDIQAPAATATPTSSDRVATGTALAQFVNRAGAIDAKKLPYQWGGGHGGKVNAYKASPLDCSGAVSAVLGINPRVSGEFTKWGKPGAGDGKGVVVYANGNHVLMSIGGKFFGTSASNPGGGAGWIPRSKISQQYLEGFTARHL